MVGSSIDELIPPARHCIVCIAGVVVSGMRVPVGECSDGGIAHAWFGER